MKSFKTFLTELSQIAHSNLYNALAGKMKLDKENALLLFPKAGRKGVFKHMTDSEGTMFLIKNKNPNISISVEKFGKFYGGIETSGSHLVIIEGNYITWSPNDATTSVGEGGIRWQGISRTKEPFPKEFKNEYFKGILKIINNDPIYPLLNEMTNKDGVNITTYANLNNFEEWNNSFTSDDPSSNPHEKTLEMKLTKYRKENPADAKVLENKIMVFQKNVLRKHSENIRKILEDEWKQKAFHVRGRGIRYDEAVIDNTKVIQIILTGHMLGSFINAVKINQYDNNENRDPFYKRLKQHIVDLKSVGYKGLISMMDFQEKFKDLRKILKDKNFKDGLEKTLDDLGLRQDREVFFKLK